MDDFRRSGRTRKSVDYSKFADQSTGGDDDDFRDASPPMKRSKTAEKQKNKLSGTKNQAGTELLMRSSPKERISVVDRKYENDIKAALQLSIQVASQEPPVLESYLDELSSARATETPVTVSGTNQGGQDRGDKITSPDDSKKKARAPTLPKSVEDDEEFRPEDGDENDDDDDDDDDEDDKDANDDGFSESDSESERKTTATNSGKKSSSKPPKINTDRQLKPVRSGQVGKPSDASSEKQISRPTSHECSRTPLGVSSVQNRRPEWTPPGLIEKSSNQLKSNKSPASGLRLGLSRTQKLKPLHANASIHR